MNVVLGPSRWIEGVGGGIVRSRTCDDHATMMELESTHHVFDQRACPIRNCYCFVVHSSQDGYGVYFYSYSGGAGRSNIPR